MIQVSQWPYCVQELYISYVSCYVVYPYIRQEPENDLAVHWWSGNKIAQAGIHACSICATARRVFMPVHTWVFCPAVFCSLRQIAWVLTTVVFLREVRHILENCYRCVWNKLYCGKHESALLIYDWFLYPSLHASSFDLAESRPASGVRLSPLDYVSTLDVTLCNADIKICNNLCGAM